MRWLTGREPSCDRALHPPPRSGGGGPPVGRWRGRGRAASSAWFKHSRAPPCTGAPSSLSDAAPQQPPPPHFVWSPSPVSWGRKREARLTRAFLAIGIRVMETIGLWDLRA